MNRLRNCLQETASRLRAHQAKMAAWLHLLSGSRGRTRELQLLFQQLRSGETELSQAASTLEKQFLATGTALAELNGFSNDFVNQNEKLVSLAVGKESDGLVFNSAIQMIEQPTQFLFGCQEQTGQMLEHLRGYNTQIEQLLRVEADLQHTMAPLKFVQTLFKVESAPMGTEVQVMFIALTQEIEKLHAQVTENFELKFKQLEQTRQIISQVIAKLAPQAQALKDSSTAHKARIDASLAKLQTELQANQERDAQLNRLSREIANEVGQIVFALQFQDIFSQKLQHVTTALPQIEAKFSSFLALPNAKKSRKELQYLCQSCRLQADQLQAAHDELVRSEATVKSSILNVLNHLGQVDSNCLSLKDFKLLTTSFDGMVQVLVESIDDSRKLVDTTVVNATDSHGTLLPLGQLASGLTAVIRTLSARIHLIGLNAQVQAARVNQGSGLNVLSAFTSEISKETTRISEKVAVQLDQLATGLADKVQAFEELRGQGLEQQSILNTQGLEEEKKLHAFRDSVLATLHASADSLAHIEECAKQTLEMIQFQEVCEPAIAALQTPLRAIADAAEKWLIAEGCEVTDASLVESFKRDYTMDSEREIFNQVVSQERAIKKALVTASVAPAMANIEMFDDFTSDSSSVATAPAPQPDSIPFPEDDKKAKAQEVPASNNSAASAGLGDNVDLF